MEHLFDSEGASLAHRIQEWEDRSNLKAFSQGTAEGAQFAQWLLAAAWLSRLYLRASSSVASKWLWMAMVFHHSTIKKQKESNTQVSTCIHLAKLHATDGRHWLPPVGSQRLHFGIFLPLLLSLCLCKSFQLADAKAVGTNQAWSKRPMPSIPTSFWQLFGSSPTIIHSRWYLKSASR